MDKPTDTVRDNLADDTADRIVPPLVALLTCATESPPDGNEVEHETGGIVDPTQTDEVHSSAKNLSVWVECLRLSGRAPPEPSETPWWWITPSQASIRRVESHIAL